MPNMNVYIDGSWLFRICASNAVLARTTETPDSNFPLDFAKLRESLLRHIQHSGGNCNEVGECYLTTSVFTLPEDFDNWPTLKRNVSQHSVEAVKQNVFARSEFVRRAVDAGYNQDGVFRPLLRDYMLEKYINRTYQEKQVDTTVVALLVRDAIVNNRDYHVLVTGDADMLPAIRIAYPEYTNNVVLCTTHPHQLTPASQVASFSLLDFQFQIEPYFLSNNTVEIIQGNNVYRCVNCNNVFVRLNPIPINNQPFCRICYVGR